MSAAIIDKAILDTHECFEKLEQVKSAVLSCSIQVSFNNIEAPYNAYAGVKTTYQDLEAKFLAFEVALEAFWDALRGKEGG